MFMFVGLYSMLIIWPMNITVDSIGAGGGKLMHFLLREALHMTQ